MARGRRTGQIVYHTSDVLDIGREADLVVVHFVLFARLILNHFIVVSAFETAGLNECYVPSTRTFTADSPL